MVPPAATLAAGHSLCTHGMQASLPIAQLSLRTQAAQDPRAPTLALLEAAGIPAHAESGRGLDDLASYIDDNKGVIVELNAGVVWDDPSAYDGGKANHAVTLTGVARDESGNIAGFFICDSGSREGRDFVPADEMREGWENAGGSCVVTDNPRSQGYPPGQGGPQFA